MRPNYLDDSFQTLINAVEKYRLLRIESHRNQLVYSTALEHLRLTATSVQIKSIAQALFEVDVAHGYMSEVNKPTSYISTLFSEKQKYLDLAKHDIYECLISMRRFEGVLSYNATSNVLY